MTVKFALGLTQTNLDDFVRCVRLAGDCGIAAIGLADSQSLWQEVWGSCALTAMDTTQVKVGPWVTNPVTRHIAVTASAALALGEISGGRAFLGIGPGDSSIYNLGLKPPPLSSLETPIRQLRGSQKNGVSEIDGHTVRMMREGRRIPIGVPASGPKGFRMAGPTCRYRLGRTRAIARHHHERSRDDASGRGGGWSLDR